MENAATINTVVTEGGTINTTVETGTTIQSTITGGGIGPQGPTGAIGPQGEPGPPGTFEPYYNVKDFGATGNGTTDDTNAIVNAIAAAVDGGTVFFPAGTYVISSVLTIGPGISMLGVGASASTIKQTSTTADGIYLSSTTVLNATLSIEALGLIGPSSGSGNGIYLAGQPLCYVSLRDIQVESFGATGVYLGGAIVSTLERVISQTNGLHGFWLDGTSSWCTSTSFNNTYANGNNAAGYYLYKTTYCSMQGAASDSNGIGYYLYDTSSFGASGCGTESSVSHGISGYTGIGWKIIGDSEFGCSSIALNGCFVYDVATIGYWIGEDSFGVVLNGCTDNEPAVGSTYSLQVDAGGTVSSAGSTWANPTLINGTYTILADTVNNYTYLRQIYATGLSITDKPTAEGSSASTLQLVQDAGTNYLESIGADNAGGAPLIIGNFEIGTEWMAFTALGAATIYQGLSTYGTLTSNGALTALDGASVTGGLTIATGGLTVTLGGVTIAAGGLNVTGTTYLSTSNIYGNLTFSTGAYIVMTGSSTGTTEIATANASATNYIVTLPAANGTVALTNATTLSSLTAVGTIVSGGLGTGAVIGDVTMTLGSDAAYDLYYRGSSGVLTRLGMGTTGQYLAAATSGAPTWGTPSGSGMTNPMTTTGDIIYSSSGSTPARLAVGGSTAVLMGGTTPVWTTTPAFGTITATSLNKVTVTTPGTSATLTLITGSSLITAGAFALTLTSTATSNATIPAGTNTLAALGLAQTWTAAQTYSTAPVINALPTGTAVASGASVSTLMTRDANGNAFAVNLGEGFTTTVTSGTLVTLTITSTQIQVFTGSTAQTVKLPTTSVVAGCDYMFINNSTAALTIESSAANTIIIIAAGGSAILTALVATPTTAANWNVQHLGINIATGKLLTVNNSLTLAGTDATTMTFPATSTTVAGLAITETFTAPQTIFMSGATSPTALTIQDNTTGAAGTLLLVEDDTNFAFGGKYIEVLQQNGSDTGTPLTIANAGTSSNSVVITNGSTTVFSITQAGLVNFAVAGITPGTTTQTTLAKTGGSGPVAAAQVGWLKVEIAGTVSFIPYFQ